MNATLEAGIQGAIGGLFGGPLEQAATTMIWEMAVHHTPVDQAFVKGMAALAFASAFEIGTGLAGEGLSMLRGSGGVADDVARAVEEGANQIDDDIARLRLQDDPLIDNNILSEAHAGTASADQFLDSNRGLIKVGQSTRKEFLDGTGRTVEDFENLLTKYDITYDASLDPSDIADEADRLQRSVAAAKFPGGQRAVIKPKDAMQLAESRLLGIDLATNDVKLYNRAKDLGSGVQFIDLFPGDGTAARAANYVPKTINLLP
ncbi:MAG: hypothetical protein ABI690_15865 [Chloroflexota bacterium]